MFKTPDLISICKPKRGLYNIKRWSCPRENCDGDSGERPSGIYINAGYGQKTSDGITMVTNTRYICGTC